MQWAVYGTNNIANGVTEKITVEAVSLAEAEQCGRDRNPSVTHVYPMGDPGPQPVLSYGKSGPLQQIMRHARWVRIWAAICGVLGWVLIVSTLILFAFALTNQFVLIMWTWAYFMFLIFGGLFLAAQAGLNLLATLASIVKDVASAA